MFASLLLQPFVYMSQVSSYFNIATSVIEDDVVGLTCLLCTSLRKQYYLIICVRPVCTYNYYYTYLLYVCNNCNHIIVASVINVKSNKHNIHLGSLAAQRLSKFSFITFLCYFIPVGGCEELTWIQQYYLFSFYQPYWSKQHAVYKQRWDQLKKLLVFRYVCVHMINYITLHLINCFIIAMYIP